MQTRRSPSLEPRAVVALLALVAPLVCAAAARPDLDTATREVVAQTNALRGRMGVSEVATNDTLTRAAQQFANYMAETDRYGHEADGRTPAERAAAAGYAYCFVAENIAYQMSTQGFTTSQLAARFVEGWEKSPPHRRNMLSTEAIDIGIGIAHSAHTQRYYAVQLFGRPKSAATEFDVANRAGVAVQYRLAGKSYELPARVTRTHSGCFEGTLQAQWPSGGTSRPIEPRNGSHYVVTRDSGGEWRLSEQ